MYITFNESFLLTVKLQLFDFLNCSFCSLYETGKETMSILYTTGTLHCLIIHVTLYSDHSVWTQAAQHLPPFQFYMKWGPHVLVHGTTINIRYLLAMFTEGTENAFLCLADKGHTNKCYSCNVKLNEPTGRDQPHLSDKIMFLHTWP
jgi:hypothetical protein